MFSGQYCTLQGRKRGIYNIFSTQRSYFGEVPFSKERILNCIEFRMHEITKVVIQKSSLPILSKFLFFSNYYNILFLYQFIGKQCWTLVFYLNKKKWYSLSQFVVYYYFSCFNKLNMRNIHYTICLRVCEDITRFFTIYYLKIGTNLLNIRWITNTLLIIL